MTRSDNDGSTTTFGYDASDQLTSEVRTGTGAYSISYTYDHNSNRKTKVLGGVTDTYSYDSHDKLLSTSSKSYVYDLNGNCTSVTVGSSTTTLTYDIENRVIGISYPGGATNSFAYNGEDLRTQKVDSTGTKNYVCDGGVPASPVVTDGAAVYTPGLSERRSGASKFYHGDALGSTRGITDTSSTPVVTDSMLYDAFGMTASRTGSTPTPFCFVGAEQYQNDSDSGLQLLGHRYYDPSVGRFLSQDPIQDGDNWYAYCNNNPLKKMDPKGTIGGLLLPILAIPGVGEVVGGVAIVGVVLWIGSNPEAAAEEIQRIGVGIGHTIQNIGTAIGNAANKVRQRIGEIWGRFFPKTPPSPVWPPKRPGEPKNSGDLTPIGENSSPTDQGGPEEVDDVTASSVEGAVKTGWNPGWPRD